jgi:hypothetical protein
LFIGKIPVKKIIKTVFLITYIFPIILASRFITQNLFWYIILFIYLIIFVYKAMSTEINCQKVRLLLTILISISVTIYVMILVSTKT